MKKRFLASTALITVGALGASPAAAKIELGLSGYMNTYFSVAAIDEASGSGVDYNATGLFSDGEVHFTGEFTADNGLTFGAVVELEALSGGDQIDERYIYIDSSFGALYAGSTNSAAYLMHYAAPYAGLPINSGWATVFVPVPSGFETAYEHPLLSTYVDFGGDDNSLTYYSPRISGFQLGLTYVPSLVFGGDGKNFPVEADTETEYHNGFAVGANYVEDFNGFGVAISGGWRYAQVDDTRDDIGTDGFDDYQAWSVGAQLSYAGFTVGGSYAHESNGIGSISESSSDEDEDGIIDTETVTLSMTEGASWDVGVSYGMGPWTFGATYFRGHSESTVESESTAVRMGGVDSYDPTPEDDKFQAVQVGLNYALGPGISLGAGVMWAEYETEDGTEQSGVAGAVGLSFSF